MKLWLGILLVFFAQVIGFFQLNAQYLSDWWKDRPVSAALVLGVPCSLFFWYSWRLIVDETGSAWTGRFIGSSMGYIIFPILTWYLLGETMFTPKTMICFSLALLIIFIQLYY